MVIADIFIHQKIIEAGGCGMKPFDINTRAVYGMRAIGWWLRLFGENIVGI